MLSISTLLLSDGLAQALLHVLQDEILTGDTRDRYRLTQFGEPQDLLDYVAQERRTVDCLLLLLSLDMPSRKRLRVSLRSKIRSAILNG